MPRARKPGSVSVAVIRHVAFEDLGVLAELFDARGWGVSYIEAPVADWGAVDLLAPDLLVVLGGPIGAYEDDLYPFLKHEVAGLQQRLAADKPRSESASARSSLPRARRPGLSEPREGNRLVAAHPFGRGL